MPWSAYRLRLALSALLPDQVLFTTFEAIVRRSSEAKEENIILVEPPFSVKVLGEFKSRQHQT